MVAMRMMSLHIASMLEETIRKESRSCQTRPYASCSWPKASLYIHPNGKPSFALLSALRLWLTPPSQRRSVGHLVYSGSQLSAKNEIIVMGWIVKNCKVILKKFVTSIVEDKLLLCTIDKVQDFCTPAELERLLSTFEREARVLQKPRV
ncbi:unnamed protein product [Camellia sinensis]